MNPVDTALANTSILAPTSKAYNQCIIKRGRVYKIVGIHTQSTFTRDKEKLIGKYMVVKSILLPQGGDEEYVAVEGLLELSAYKSLWNSIVGYNTLTFWGIQLEAVPSGALTPMMQRLVRELENL